MTEERAKRMIMGCWFGAMSLLCATVAAVLHIDQKLQADEQQRPIGVAGDIALLSDRVARLEARVEALESGSRAEEASASAAEEAFVEELPVLEVQSESWCAACKVFEADVAANGQEGKKWRLKRVNLKSSSIPAFRFTGKGGTPQTSVGYTRGRLSQWLGEMGVR